MDFTSLQKALVGYTLHYLRVGTSDRYCEHLEIVTREGYPVFLRAEGDCCSETWFADILQAVSVSGGVVTGVRELEMPDVDGDGRTRQEYDAHYGFAIDTTKGTVTVAYRNSSNGYYGGHLTVVSPDRVPADLEWQRITVDDWSA